ncbi:hypothetical protein Agub_g4298, partial [Astrephomene gubernaculifera]
PPERLPPAGPDAFKEHTRLGAPSITSGAGSAEVEHDGPVGQQGRGPEERPVRAKASPENAEYLLRRRKIKELKEGREACGFIRRLRYLDTALLDNLGALPLEDLQQIATELTSSELTTNFPTVRSALGGSFREVSHGYVKQHTDDDEVLQCGVHAVLLRTLEVFWRKYMVEERLLMPSDRRRRWTPMEAEMMMRQVDRLSPLLGSVLRRTAWRGAPLSQIVA